MVKLVSEIQSVTRLMLQFNRRYGRHFIARVDGPKIIDNRNFVRNRHTESVDVLPLSSWDKTPSSLWHTKYLIFSSSFPCFSLRRTLYSYCCGRTARIKLMSVHMLRAGTVSKW